MSQWTDRFRGHEIWQTLAGLRTQVEDRAAPEEPEGRGNLERIRWVIEHLSERQENTDPQSMVPSMLDGTNQHLGQVQAHLNQWTEDTPEQLQAAAAQVDNVVQSLGSWPPLLPSRWGSGFNKTAQAMENAVDATIQHLREQRDEASAEAERLSARITELESAVQTQTQRIDDAVASFESSGSTKIDELAERKEQDLDGKVAGWTDEQQARSETAEAHLEELQKLETEARNTVHGTTAVMVSTEYGQYARNKTIAAWLCDVSAAVVGAVGVAAILFHLYSSPEGDTVGLSLTRLAASLGTIGIAALIGRRGHLHHQEARAAKRTELALRRVGNFTANLSQEDREAIVKAVAHRIFIQGRLDDPQQAADGTSPLLSGLFGQANAGTQPEPPQGQQQGGTTA